MPVSGCSVFADELSLLDALSLSVQFIIIRLFCVCVLDVARFTATLLTAAMFRLATVDQCTTLPFIRWDAHTEHISWSKLDMIVSFLSLQTARQEAHALINAPIYVMDFVCAHKIGTEQWSARIRHHLVGRRRGATVIVCDCVWAAHNTTQHTHWTLDSFIDLLPPLFLSAWDQRCSRCRHCRICRCLNLTTGERPPRLQAKLFLALHTFLVKTQLAVVVKTTFVPICMSRKCESIAAFFLSPLRTLCCMPFANECTATKVVSVGWNSSAVSSLCSLFFRFLSAS